MNSNAVFPGIEEKISDRIKLIHWGNNRLVIEKRYSLWFRQIDTIFLLSMIIFFASIILIFVFLALFEMLSKLNIVRDESQKFDLFCLFSFLTFLLLIILSYFIVREFVNVERVILDMDQKTVRIEKEKREKVDVENQFPISAIKNVKVDVDSYNDMSIYLDYNFGSICIIGYEVTENKKKLEIAHKIAKFLGVPVIEKT